MREIKFRGKTNEPVGDKKIWIFGDLLQPTMVDNIYEISDCESMDGSRYDVMPETIGQYTGLKDKNGKEIYEGDIVEINSLNKKTKEKGLIEYSEQYLSYIITNTNSPIDEAENLSEYAQIELIGNIYDNPKLLEKGKE